VHNSSPLLQLVGGSLQLGEQEVVQAGVAVEELSACDGPPCRLSLSCTPIVSPCDCIPISQHVSKIVASVQRSKLAGFLCVLLQHEPVPIDVWAAAFCTDQGNRARAGS